MCVAVEGGRVIASREAARWRPAVEVAEQWRRALEAGGGGWSDGVASAAVVADCWRWEAAEQ